MLYLLSILLLSCSSYKPEKPQLLPNVQQLQVKANLYETLIKEELDEHGFLYTEWCDSLLFTSLLLDKSTDIVAAESETEPGRFYRRPSKDCYPDNGATSDVSKDMFLGLAWWAKNTGNYGIAERALDYGKAHDWIMGDGNPGATWMSWALRGTYAEIAYQGGYKEHEDLRNSPQLWSGSTFGYQAHLEILHILLRSSLKGSIDINMKAVIDEHYIRVPENALFAFAHHVFDDGKMEEVIDILMDEKLFPALELPIGCEEWLWQREPSEWLEMDCDKPFKRGGDLIFLAKLVKEYLQQ